MIGKDPKQCPRVGIFVENKTKFTRDKGRASPALELEKKKIL
jgi:hypothetical protein